MSTKEKLTNGEKKALSLIAGIITGTVAVIIVVYIFVIGKDISRDKNNTTEAGVDISGTEQGISEAEQDIPGTGQITSGTEQDMSGEEQPEIFAVEKPVTLMYAGQEDEKHFEYENGELLEDNGRTYAIKVNRQENVVTVYTLDEEGYYTVPVKAMSCSTAEGNGTPAGIYKTSSRYRWAYLQGDVCGQYAYRIVNHILFHSVPYLDMEADTLETWEYNKLGTDASMGCIRLCAADAKWIYENCETGTQVEIYDSDYPGPLGRPSPPYIFEDNEPGAGDNSDVENEEVGSEADYDSDIENAEDESGTDNDSDVENAEEAAGRTDYDPTDMTEGNPYASKMALYGVRTHHINTYEPFDDMAGVMAFGADMEDITDRVQVSGSVDSSIPGEYELTYYVKDGESEITKSIEIIVDDTSAPVILYAPKELTIEMTDSQPDEEAFYRQLEKTLAKYVTIKDNGIACSAAGADMSGYGMEFVVDFRSCKPEAGSYNVNVSARDAAGNVSDTFCVSIIIK